MRLLISIFALCLCTSAMAVAGTANFGTAPSGQIPILYNNHTVYAKPDILKQDRVLAALVKDGQIYVPLRSMFEQMGATVTVSADGNTYTVTRSDVSASVTLGKNEVVVNGTTRRLDVPPMLYKGVVLVPVRVLSEALGAYVKWVSGRNLVVVRYNPPTPMPAPTEAPTPEPTMSPTPEPTATPIPIPAVAPYGFIEIARARRQIYNEFSAGKYCRSYLISAAYAFRNSPFAIKLDYRQDSYVTSDNYDAFGNHYTQFSTIDRGTAITPVFLANQSNLDARIEYKIAKPKIYVGVSYIQTNNNYGYPQLRGLGAGIEKLPDLRPGVSFYGSAFYFPTASGDYTVNSATSSNNTKTYRQQYAISKYDLGLALVLRNVPVYIYGGFSADQYAVKQNAPIGQTHNGPYLGLGVKF